jgi:hypothetical protein
LFGIGALTRGKRKDRLAAALDGVLDLFSARILPFDTAAHGLAVASRVRSMLPV